MAKARHSNSLRTNRRGDANGGPDPFSFARSMLDPWQFFGLGGSHDRTERTARSAPDPLQLMNTMLSSYAQVLAVPADQPERTPSPVPDPLQLTDTMLSSYAQVLGLAALAAETMRLATRQAQIHVEYMQALRQCRNWADLGSINMEFSRRIVQEASEQFQALASSTQRLLGETHQTVRS
jgi:hypothetical protein